MLRCCVLLSLLWALPPAFAIALDSNASLIGAQKQASPQIQQALNALEKGDWAAAETAFKEAAKLNPASATPYLGLAELYARKKDLKAAEAWLRKARATEPSNVDLVRTWARFEFNRKNFAAAETALKEALALDPNATWAHINLAENYLLGLKRPNDAAAAYRQALKLDPANSTARMGLAAALAKSGHADEAIAEFEKAANATPADPRPVHAIARIHASRADVDRALQTLERAIKIDPNYAPARIEKGDLLLAKGDAQGAVAAYQSAAAQPSGAIAHFKLGSIYQAQQKWDDAQNAYLAAIKSDPTMASAYNNLAWMAAERKQRLGDALQWAKKALELAPENAALHDTLGWVHRARGEWDLAIAAHEKAIQKAPAQANYHYHLGVVYSDKGDKQKASAALKKSLDLGKQQPPFPNAERAQQLLHALAK